MHLDLPGRAIKIHIGTFVAIRALPLAAVIAVAIILSTDRAASGGFITVYGGPTYDSASGNGYTAGLSAPSVNDSGAAVGIVDKYAAGSAIGLRAVRWDSTGAGELPNIAGASYGSAWAINDAGVAVGESGNHAARWDAAGVTQLGSLSGSIYSNAFAINASGTAVGYSGDASNGSSIRAVRWDASGTATELGNLGTDSKGHANGGASVINNAGTAAGTVEKYNGIGADLGPRAVRWAATGTAATELDPLYVNPSSGIAFTK